MIPPPPFFSSGGKCMNIIIVVHLFLKGGERLPGPLHCGVKAQVMPQNNA